jgi:hypothetical protein
MQKELSRGGDAPIVIDIVFVEVVAGVRNSEVVCNVDHHSSERHTLLHNALSCLHVN